MSPSLEAGLWPQLCDLSFPSCRQDHIRVSSEPVEFEEANGESLRLGCQEQVGGNQFLRGRGRREGRRENVLGDGGVKGTQEGRHPSLTICPVSLEGKFQGRRAHCLVPNLNWTEFNKCLSSLVGRCLELLWLTQKKQKVPGY